MMGSGGGVGGKLVGGAGPSVRQMSILMWGGHGAPGRGGGPGGAGFVRVDGNIDVGSVITYVIGNRTPANSGRYPGGNYNPNYFFNGGSAGGNPTARASGAFTGAWIGAAPTVDAGASTRALGVAGGSGAGGDDGLNQAWGGAGGGPQASDAAEEPPLGMYGRGASDSAGGAGGSNNGNSGAFLQGGSGRPTHSNTGGGGGGWYGGGGGGSTGPSEAGGGGGSGMVRAAGGTYTDLSGAMTFEVTNFHDAPTQGPLNLRGEDVKNGGFDRTGDPYAPTIPSPTTGSYTGKVVILVDGSEVVNSTTSTPDTAGTEYTVV